MKQIKTLEEISIKAQDLLHSTIEAYLGGKITPRDIAKLTDDINSLYDSFEETRQDVFRLVAEDKDRDIVNDIVIISVYGFIALSGLKKLHTAMVLLQNVDTLSYADKEIIKQVLTVAETTRDIADTVLSDDFLSHESEIFQKIFDCASIFRVLPNNITGIAPENIKDAVFQAMMIQWKESVAIGLMSLSTAVTSKVIADFDTAIKQ